MKTLLLHAFMFGTGFATIAAVGIGLFLFHKSRPQPELPWQSNVLTARLSDIDVWTDVSSSAPVYLDEEGDPISSEPRTETGTVEFTYIVENRGASDYSTDGSSVVVMARRADGLVHTGQDIKVEYPIFIPSRQKVAVKIVIPYGSAVGPIGPTDDVRKAVAQKLPKLQGFALFDRASRYRVDFPKEW